MLTYISIYKKKDDVGQGEKADINKHLFRNSCIPDARLGVLLCLKVEIALMLALSHYIFGLSPYTLYTFSFGL